MAGRHPKIPPEILRPLLTELRASGVAAKVIGGELGYSEGWIKILCSAWGIRKVFKYQRRIDPHAAKTVGFAAEGARQPANPPAVSEATPDDTPTRGLTK